MTKKTLIHPKTSAQSSKPSAQRVKSKSTNSNTKTSDGVSTFVGSAPWVYSEKVKDHFLAPRNFLMGDESQFAYDAVGQVGNPVCGDQMRMYIKVQKNKIVDIRWKTYGCASAIASTSALSEMVKGKTLEAALKIDANAITQYLGGLPKHKFHCSVLGNEALAAAIKAYRTQRCAEGQRLAAERRAKAATTPESSQNDQATAKVPASRPE